MALAWSRQVMATWNWSCDGHFLELKREFTFQCIMALKASIDFMGSWWINTDLCVIFQSLFWLCNGFKINGHIKEAATTAWSPSNANNFLTLQHKLNVYPHLYPLSILTSQIKVHLNTSRNIFPCKKRSLMKLPYPWTTRMAISLPMEQNTFNSRDAENHLRRYRLYGHIWSVNKIS